MSSTQVKNNDLQSYLDSFNKEIAGGQIETIDMECIDVIDQSEDNTDHRGTYFVDQSGNFYCQDTHNALTIASNQSDDIVCSIRKKDSGISFKDVSKKTIAKKIALKIDANNDDEDNMDYVLILGNTSEKDLNSNELDDDDPEKEIFDFDDSETIDEDEKELLIPRNIIRMKSNSTDINGVTHSCMHCDYSTSKRYLLSRHLRAHSDDRPHKCSVCERGYKSNASLVNHVNTHLGNKPHQCKYCVMAFTTSGELVRHVRYKHTLEKPHKCTECDYASVELSKLKRHMRCHTGERPYQCPHCTYASPDTFKLKRHMRTHTGEKPYECDICHARFTQSNSMKAHRMIHSVGDKPVFQCSFCPTTCGRKTDLRIHIQKLHQSDEPIHCKRCGKILKDRYSYKVHIKTHEGEKCYRCTLCPYASISLRHLESHMLIHTDQKPFICAICELSFRQKQLLKRHMNLYHNKDYVPPKPREKRHTCPDCKRSFSHKGNLMRHMEMHDPDSNLIQEKMNLKLGRKTRVSADGSIEILSTADDMDTIEYYEGDIDYYEGNEDFEIVETIPEQKPACMSDKKQIITSKHIELLPDIKTESIKKEPDGKEFAAVEGSDGQQFMIVEVIHCGEDELTDATSEDNTNSDDNIVNIGKSDFSNCFGFEDPDKSIYDEDSDNKETIQLLEIIDDD